MNKPLSNTIALVAGATRGAGRGIACMLGEAGATVYCTGRSTRESIATEGRSETIDETAEMVTARGGKGIAVKCDHLVEEEVADLFERVRSEQGRLDVLVNDVWGGDSLMEWGKPFWEMSVEKGLLMERRGLHSHLITSRHGAPLMVEKGKGLIIEITDGDTLGYRGNFYYDLVKTAIIRVAYTMAHELRPHGVAAVALTPGFLRSEEMLDRFGVTEENWRDGAKVDPHFIASETPFYVGRAAAVLAADPEIMRKSGRSFSSWGLAEEYGFTDIDGSQPNFDTHLKEVGFPGIDDVKKPDEVFYSYWVGL